MRRSNMPPGGYLGDFAGRAALRKLAHEVADLSGLDFEDTLSVMIEANAIQRSPNEQISHTEIELESDLHHADQIREITHQAISILAEPDDPDEEYNGDFSPEQREQFRLSAVALLEEHPSPHPIVDR